MKVLKIVADTGVYYTNKPDVNIPYGQSIKMQMQIEMSEEEYEKIPATEEASKFFRGEVVGQRPKE